MFQEKEFDRKLQEEIELSVIKIQPSNHLKDRIVKDIRKIREESVGNKMRKGQSLFKRIAVAAVALCIIVPTTVIASGKITSLVSKSSVAPEYTEYSEIEKAEKELGYDVKTVEKFTNGMLFQSVEVMNTAAQDADGNEVGTYKGLGLHYKSQEGVALSVYAEKPFVSDETVVERIDSTDMVGDIQVRYTEDDYKFVPVGYVVTPEEQTAMDNGELYISEGADEVELSKVQHANWEEDGVSYTLMASDTDMVAADFFQMAGEIITQ